MSTEPDPTTWAAIAPERRRALLDLADQSLALEGTTDRVTAIAVIRDDDGLRYTISCERRHLAIIRSEPLPQCHWERESKGYRCRARAGGRDCGRYLGPGMARYDLVDTIMGGTDPRTLGLRRVTARIDGEEWTSQWLVSLEADDGAVLAAISEASGMVHSHLTEGWA